MLARTDGTGLRLLQSSPRALTLPCVSRVFQFGSIVDGARLANSLMSFGTSAAAASLSGEFVSISGAVSFEGLAAAGSPAAVSSLSVYQSGSRLVLSFPRSSTFTSDLKYFLYYYSVTSTVPIGSVEISSGQSIDGSIFQQLSDPELTNFNIINHGNIKAGKLMTMTEIPFKFVLIASNSAGSSSRTSVYAVVSQQEYYEVSEYYSPAILGIGITVLVCLLVISGGFAFYYYRAQEKTMRSIKPIQSTGDETGAPNLKSPE